MAAILRKLQFLLQFMLIAFALCLTAYVERTTGEAVLQSKESKWVLANNWAKPDGSNLQWLKSHQGVGGGGGGGVLGNTPTCFMIHKTKVKC